MYTDDWKKSHDCINPDWSDSYKQMVLLNFEAQKKELKHLTRIFSAENCINHAKTAAKIAEIDGLGRLEVGRQLFKARKLTRAKNDIF